MYNTSLLGLNYMDDDAGVYYPGLEDEIYKTTRPEITGNSQEKLCKRIIKDYTIAA